MSKLRIVRQHSHCGQFMGKWKISCKCQQCGLWFGHLRILEFWFHPWLWELIRNVFYLKIHWTSQVPVQVSEPVGLSFIFLFVLIIIIGPTFIIFISPPALAFISMPIILLFHWQTANVRYCLKLELEMHRSVNKKYWGKNRFSTLSNVSKLQ